MAAGMVEAGRRMEDREAKPDAATRRLAAKRVGYRDAAGTDYGSPCAISARS